METPSEVTLGAFFGRYKGWRSLIDVAVVSTNPEEGGDGALPLPTGAVVVQFEATAKEDLRVGFAAHGSTQWLYEVALGFSGNTEVVVRKAVGSGRGAVKEVDLIKVFSGRTCATEQFVPYWLVVQNGTIVFGVGNDVGVDTVAKVVDPQAEQVHQTAFTTWNQGATIRNLRCELVSTPVAVEQMTPRVVVRSDPFGQEDLLTEEQRNEYLRECDVIQKRVQRFGGEFQAPDIKKYMDPKVIRRLQRTGATERGFATGIDMLSNEEEQKRKARMERFNTPQFAVEYSAETARALQDGLTQEEWAEREAEREKLRERALKFGLDPDANPKSGAKTQNLKPASKKVREERCDIKGDTMIDFRDDAIHVYSLDERFQQVRTNDIMEYFAGFGPWYVEWINDSACTVVFEDAHTAGRALIALGDEIPAQFIKPRRGKGRAEANAAPEAESTPAAEAAPTPAPGADGDIDMDGDDSANASAEPAAMTDAPIDEASAPAEIPDEDFNRSQWRYGQPIGSASQGNEKRWRILLRRATADDFPPEKEGRKYHERRSQPQKRGRGHQQRNRAHPYRRDRGNRRDRRQFDE
ncbi:hypothetical protein Poli38472_009629 [Pythium oligandrum]|uniref:Farnesoic acid O-methyl transferase domain-containing protein n=1 Tax=Pythium oligandrum TaxID=41045 RepID=A0A8K1CEV2_PYTOL|nr:hypothetical protein Poli38472_009629 [Pythium oligandrum]|eukprot:TMW62136.1 hypothetical protein Poli38472_009629 [Pythium oligandrum]